jgi:DNA polymerase-3 subunit epsilon
MSNSGRWAVLDVETSGLKANRHRILQIALVTVVPNADGIATITDEWSSYARPFLRHVGPKHVHGLTARQLRDAPNFADIVPAIVERLNGATLVAHNIEFDWPFLRRALRRSGYQAPDTERLCTLRLSRSLDPDRTLRHRLPDLAARHGITLVDAHDALADARATAQLLPGLLAEAGPRAEAFTDGVTNVWPTPNAARKRFPLSLLQAR